jgi:hypothetical protein
VYWACAAELNSAATRNASTPANVIAFLPPLARSRG